MHTIFTLRTSSISKGVYTLALLGALIIGAVPAHATAPSGIDTPTGVLSLPLSVAGTPALTFNATGGNPSATFSGQVYFNGPINMGSMPNSTNYATTIKTDGSAVIGSNVSTTPSALTVNGKMGINTAAPAGTLDIENSTTTATLCLNGNCSANMAPQGCHQVYGNSGNTNVTEIAYALCASNEYVMSGGGVANQWTGSTSICPGDPNQDHVGFIHTSIPYTDTATGRQGWAVDAYAWDHSGEVCTTAIATCCPR